MYIALLILIQKPDRASFSCLKVDLVLKSYPLPDRTLGLNLGESLK